MHTHAIHLCRISEYKRQLAPNEEFEVGVCAALDYNLPAPSAACVDIWDL